MTIEQLLRAIRASSLILLSNARLWAPNTHVSMETRRAIRDYRRELLRMIAAHHWDVCPAPDLHRGEVYYRDGVFYCGACERLSAWIA